MIETVFRHYKDANEFDETRMHPDYSVISPPLLIRPQFQKGRAYTLLIQL